MISVRTARHGDGRLLLQTTGLLAHLHGMGHRFTATAEQYEEALFNDHPIVGALIAEADGAFAGSLVWHRSFSTNSAREIIYLEDLVVLEPHRRKGVARALMRALARLAVDRGVRTVYWLMADWNDGAEDFYKSLGADIDKGFSICTVKDEALKGLTQ